MKRALIVFSLFLSVLSMQAQTVTVSTEAEFIAALTSSANTILLKPGTYRFNQTLTIDKGKTVGPEIAGALAGVFFSSTEGGSNFLIKILNGATLQGIYFKDIYTNAATQATSALVQLDRSTLQFCVFDGRSFNRTPNPKTNHTGDFVLATNGSKIYYNTFYDMKEGGLLSLDTKHIGKLNPPFDTEAYTLMKAIYATPDDFYKTGVLDSRLTFLTVGGCHVKGNFFYNPKIHSATGVTKSGNGKYAIKTGNGEVCFGYHLIEENLFYDVSAEPECIELKGKRTLVRYNTFYKCSSNLSLRHGSHTVVYGNYFLNQSGGIALWGDSHQVVNNYFYKSEKPILLNSGCDNTRYDKSMHITYVASSNSLFANNTMVECGPIEYNYALRMWKDGRVVGVSGEKFVNNFIYQTKNDNVLKKLGGTDEELQAANVLFNSNLITTSDSNVKSIVPASENELFKTAQKIAMVAVRYGEYNLLFPTIPANIHQLSAKIPEAIHTMYGVDGLSDSPWQNQDLVLRFDMTGKKRDPKFKGIGAFVGTPTVAELSSSTGRVLRPSDLASGFLGAPMKMVSDKVPTFEQ